MKNTKPLSFEEFKLFYESTETVTQRRIELNRWNYSINVAILVAVAAITNWAFQNTALFWFAVVAAGVLSLMAIFLCTLWIGQIHDYKKLNTAKFDVLAQMAPRIEFDLGNPGVAESYEPFRREWERLQELDGLKSWGSGIKVLRASHHEFFIPRAFQMLFMVLLVLLACSALRNAPKATTPTKAISAPTPP